MRKTREERETEIRDAEAELKVLRPLHNDLARKLRDVKAQIKKQTVKIERARTSLNSVGWQS